MQIMSAPIQFDIARFINVCNDILRQPVKSSISDTYRGELCSLHVPITSVTSSLTLSPVCSTLQGVLTCRSRNRYYVYMLSQRSIVTSV